METRSKNSKMK